MSKVISQQNLFSAFKAIDAVGSKYKATSLEHFRKAVWVVFEELVLTTPQFTGLAAASWNIGIDAADLSVDYTNGEQWDIRDKKDGSGGYSSISPRHVGDLKWAEEAFERNRYKLRQIKSGTRVFITNAVQGEADMTGGRAGSSYYLADLQDESYWAEKLRLVNMPYKTVSDVILGESWRDRLTIRNTSQRFFQ